MRKKKKPQTELPLKGPGVEALEIPELDDAVNCYVDVRDKRMELTKKEVLAREALRLSMHRYEAKLAKDGDTLLYRCDDLIVRCTSGHEKISVKSVLESEEID